MKLYVYYFNCSTKEVESASVEVEEKPKTYKVVNGVIPFIGISKVLKDDLNNVNRLTYISEKDDIAKAVREFRKFWGQKAQEAKDQAACYDDYYRSCFKYSTPDGTVMLS